MKQAEKIAQALYDKKARDIQVLDISELTSLGEYFVICTCGSSVQVKACADEVEEKMAEEGIHPAHREGYQSGDWILMDYGTVIVHIMQKQTREFYDLERLWSDAKQVEITLK